MLKQLLLGCLVLHCPHSSLLAQMRERRAQAATGDLGVAVPLSRLQSAGAPQATGASAVGDRASASASTTVSNQAVSNQTVSNEGGAKNRFRGPRSSLGDGARAIHRVAAQPAGESLAPSHTKCFRVNMFLPHLRIKDGCMSSAVRTRMFSMFLERGPR